MRSKRFWYRRGRLSAVLLPKTNEFKIADGRGGTLTLKLSDVLAMLHLSADILASQCSESTLEEARNLLSREP